MRWLRDKIVAETADSRQPDIVAPGGAIRSTIFIKDALDFPGKASEVTQGPYD
ncbi:unnamed protein product [Umbelopsis vinacea]